MGGQQPVEKIQFAVVCIDRKTGKTLWTKVLSETVPHEGHHQTHGFASGSPITDGKMLYAYFGSRGLYALDFDGNVKWEKDFGLQQTRNGFGEGTSPALAGDRLIINWDHEGADFIAAVDKATGKELWRTPRNEPTGWSTPCIVEHAGVTQAIVPATGKTRSYDVRTGALLWECGGQVVNVIPSVVAFEGLAIAMSGYQGYSVQAIKLGSKGDVTGTDAVAWSYNKGTPYVASPLLYGGKLYFYSGTDARLSIFDAKTGERHLEAERLEGITGVYSSPTGADGRIYQGGRDGGVVVFKQGTKLEYISKTKLDEPVDAQPVAVGKDLIIRCARSLYCFAAN
jgi:outer membrane protein assembly factor BamB